MSRTPCVVALKSTRSIMPERSGFSLATARKCVVRFIADFIREFTDDRPNGLFYIVRLKRDIKSDKFFIMRDKLEGLFARTDFLGDAVDFIVINIAQAFYEYERENEIFVFRRVDCAMNAARGVPYPRFHRLIFRAICH